MKTITHILAALALTLSVFPAHFASAQGEVNLYTDRQEVFLRPVLDAFKRETGAEVNVLFIKAGLRERMRAEGASSPADVVLVVDVGALSDIADDGLTQRPPENLTGHLLKIIPASYRDPELEWFGVTRRARILYVRRGGEDRARDYSALADPEWRGKVCTRSGRHSYNIGLISNMVATLGEEGAREWLAGFKNNLARKPQGNDRAQIKGVLSGECGIGVGNSYYFFQTLKNAESDAARDELREKVVPVYPPNPNVNITGMAMAKHSPNPENAAKLMRFFVSPQAQKLYAGENREFPVRDDVEWPAELAPHREDLQNPGASLARLAELRATASQMVEDADFDR